MSRPVPAVERAIQILELMAERPHELLGLSEVARALGMNKASCHATLTLLAERDYLIRHDDKTYSLGPAVLTLANSFLLDQDALPHARVEMASLSRDLDLDCVASGVSDDKIVVLARSSSAGSFGVDVRVGTHFALVPPVGTVFLAWATRDRVERWLADIPGGASAEQRARSLDALAIVRDRGYSVALGSAFDADTDAARAIDDYLLFELDEKARLPVTHIAAPVFDPAGTVRLALTVVGFHDRLGAQDLPAVAERLLDATRQVSRRSWGVVGDASDGTGSRLGA